MSKYRVFLKPFDDAGAYLSDYIEVTDDVLSIGPISQGLDNSTYDIGIFKTSGVTIKFRNDHGYYSDPENYRSIFGYKRQDTLIKITWDARSYPLKAGFFKADPGTPIGGQTTIFEGLLFEVSSVATIDNQDIQFRFAGFDSLFDRVSVNYSSISNGDLFSEALYTMLNQSTITQFLTVSSGNIVCSVDETIDDKTTLENKTVREAIDSGDLLLAASSVLYIDSTNTLYVADRSASATSQYTFYGQASITGIENVIDITDYRDGVNKVFNYATWPDTARLSQNSDSILKYGVNKIEISNDLISNASTAKIDNILDGVVNEFNSPKKEFSIVTPINYDTIALSLKDKVNVDYPTIYRSADDNPIPRWGLDAWGSFRWPIGQYSLTISSDINFKIMGKKIDPSKDVITFDLREA